MNTYFKAAKRKASSDGEGQGAKRRKQDGQYALISSEVKVPLDDAFPVSSGKEKVYIDNSDGMIYDVTLNQADISKNANKFYRIQIVKVGKDDFRLHTRWGRVGSYGTSKTYPAVEEWQALSEFRARFLLKTGLNWNARDQQPEKGKYTFLQKSYVQNDYHDSRDTDLTMILDLPGRSSIPAEVLAQYIPHAVCQLLDLIFEGKYIENSLEDIGYNQAKTPIGLLSTRTIRKGYLILAELDNLIRAGSRSSEESLIDASNRYYSVIPHVLSSRMRLPVIKSNDMLSHEITMLDNLSQLEVTAKIKRDAPRGSRLAQLKLEKIVPLEHTSTEFQNLSRYLENTSGHHHNTKFTVKNIFQVSRKGESARFLASKFARLRPENSDRRLLWHGSKSSNFGGILSKGLRIAPPEVPGNGYAFGKGIYFADCSTKSANYCCAQLSDKQALLLLCEVELGNPMKDAEWGRTGDPRDNPKYLSTHGIGSYGPNLWVDAGIYVNENLDGVKMPHPHVGLELREKHHLRYDEYVVYSEAQVQIRYILHVEM